jgi:hypothetical protein
MTCHNTFNQFHQFHCNSKELPCQRPQINLVFIHESLLYIVALDTVFLTTAHKVLWIRILP